VDELEHGLELIREGRYFEAHEELELVWRAADASERDFYQGLVHVAVAWYQAGRGRRIATASQLEKAARRLGAFVPEHRGVDVASVLAQVETARGVVRSGSLEPRRTPALGKRRRSRHSASYLVLAAGGELGRERMPCPRQSGTRLRTLLLL